MEHVFQKHESGCGVACVAMLGDISYNKAMRIMHPFRFPFTSASSKHKNFIRAFNKLNMNYKIHRWDPSMDLRKLKNNAIVVIFDFNIGHAVVWDAINQKIMEPFPGFKRNFEYYQSKVIQVIEVW